MAEEKAPIQTISSRIDWECPYYRVRRDAIRLPDGSAGIYNIVEAPDSVFVVPVTADNRIVLIRNYRYTLGQWVWEVPAGSIKAGQSPEEAAREELGEEIGGTSDNLQFLMKASTMNGIGHNYAHFYLARDVQLSQPEHEAAEVITIHPMAIDAVYLLVERGEMNDVSSMTALFLARGFLV